MDSPRVFSFKERGWSLGFAAQPSGETEASAGLAGFGCVSSLLSSPPFFVAGVAWAACALDSTGGVISSLSGAREAGMHFGCSAAGFSTSVSAGLVFAVSLLDSSGLSPELARKTEFLFCETFLQKV